MRSARYVKLCYGPFRWVDKKPRPSVTSLLYRADFSMTPGMFVGVVVFTSAIATAATVAVSILVLRDFLKFDLWLPLSLIMGGAALVVSVSALPMIAYNRLSGKRVKIEASLPFVLAYMATLSSAGMNPVDTIRHVGLKDFGMVSKEFRKIVYRFDILGEDILASIEHVANSTSSEVLRGILIGISNIIFSGGSMRDFCEQQAHELFDLKRAGLKGFIDSLAMFSEAYLGGIIVSIVMCIIGIIIAGAMGIHIGNLSTQQVFMIFVFVVVPLANILFLAVLEVRYSSGEY